MPASGSSSPNRSMMRAAQLVDVERRGVDDDVGLLLHRLEQRALALDGLGHALPRLEQRVAAARCSRSGGRARRCRRRGTAGAPGRPTARSAASAGAERRRGRRRRRRRARRAAWPSPAREHELGDLRDELGRQVVDHEPAEVLEVVGRLRPPRPDSPVMTTNSLICLDTYRSRSGLLQAEEEEARDGGRGLRTRRPGRGSRAAGPAPPCGAARGPSAASALR